MAEPIIAKQGRARSSGGRCACAHSRCDRTCSVDAADRTSLSVAATTIFTIAWWYQNG